MAPDNSQLAQKKASPYQEMERLSAALPYIM